jgi:hypothetical protein
MAGRHRVWFAALLAVGCAAQSGARSAERGETSSDDESATLQPRPGTGQAERPSDASGATFTPRVPHPGSVRIDESLNRVRLELSQRQDNRTTTVVQQTTQRLKTRTTVLAANEAAVTKKRVEYLQGLREQRLGDRVERVTNPLQGKTYLLEIQGGRLLATGPRGESISDYERELLVEQNPHLGKPSGFAVLLPHRPLGIGERLTPDPAALAEVFAAPGAEVREAYIVLIAVVEQQGGRQGRFEVGFTVVDAREQSIVETQLGGTVVLQADTCWPLEVSLSGPVRVEGKPPNRRELRGSGEASTLVRSRYE